MNVKFDHQELWFYYDDWSGYGEPDIDSEVPDNLYNRYLNAKQEFFQVLNELREFLDDC